jgi:hypothetical protein
MARVALSAFDMAGAVLVASGCGWIVHDAWQAGQLPFVGSSPAPVARHGGMSSLFTQAHADALQTNGFVVIPNALSPQALTQARCAVQELGMNQTASPFQITGQEEATRRDAVCWIGNGGSDANNLTTANETTLASAPRLDAALVECCAMLRGVAFAVESRRPGRRGDAGNEKLGSIQLPRVVLFSVALAFFDYLVKKMVRHCLLCFSLSAR